VTTAKKDRYIHAVGGAKTLNELVCSFGFKNLTVGFEVVYT